MVKQGEYLQFCRDWMCLTGTAYQDMTMRKCRLGGGGWVETGWLRLKGPSRDWERGIAEQDEHDQAERMEYGFCGRGVNTVEHRANQENGLGGNDVVGARGNLVRT